MNKVKRISFVIVGLFLVSVLFVFTPIDLYMRNTADFSISFKSFFMISSLTGLAIFVLIECCFFLIDAISNMIAEFGLVLLFSTAILVYLQSNYFSISTDLLTGIEPEWSKYKFQHILNLCIWILVVFLVCLIAAKCRSRFYSISVFISSVLLIAMSVVVLFSYGFNGMLFSSNNETGDEGFVYTSDENEFTFSENGDVLIFTLDTFDTRLLDRIIEEEPEKIDFILNDGFVYYTNTAGTYINTDPSVVALLTGCLYKNEEPFFQFCRNAFETSRDYYDGLKDQGYSVNFYATPMYSVPASVSEVVDNLKTCYPSAHISNLKPFMSCLGRYIIFKCGPTILQQFVYMDFTSIFEKAVSEYDDISDRVTQDDYEMRERFEQNGIKVDNSRKYFKYYLMEGSHAPYILNEKGEKVEEGTSDVYTQTKGSLAILRMITNELKAKGVYENTTIIVTGDHGDELLNPETIENRCCNPVMLIKRSNETNSKLRYSSVKTSLLDIRATIYDILEMNYDKYGVSVYHLEQEKDRERYFYTYRWVEPRQEGFYFREIKEYLVPEKANDISNYTLTGNIYLPSNDAA